MSSYQLAFLIPGISPKWASLRKQSRQIPKSRITAWGRPHRLHRVYLRTANFGVLLHLLTNAFLAILAP